RERLALDLSEQRHHQLLVRVERGSRRGFHRWWDGPGGIVGDFHDSLVCRLVQEEEETLGLQARPLADEAVELASFTEPAIEAIAGQRLVDPCAGKVAGIVLHELAVLKLEQ